MPKPLIQSTGRRKAAVARVRLRPGTGVVTVNRRPIDDYFPSATHRMIITEPLRLVEKAEEYDVDTTLDGGGVSGQAGALRLGIARALVELDPDVRAPLKKAGFLTHDAREKSRRSTASRRPARLRSTPSAELRGNAVPLRFGTDGIRGVAGAELTPELVLALGRAAARVVVPPRSSREVSAPQLMVGRDTRLSGPMLAFSAGAASEGVEIVDLGVLPTPGVAAVARARAPRQPWCRRPTIRSTTTASSCSGRGEQS